MVEPVHRKWMSPVPAKVHPGMISRKEKVVKSKIKLGLPFMMYIFQIIYLRETSLL
jgi:hypothetical protein